MRRVDIFTEFDLTEDEPLFTTGVVSRVLNIPDWVLKRLDNEGIVCPKREQRSARLYSARELKTIKFCWTLMQERGVKMKGLKVIIEIQSGEFK